MKKYLGIFVLALLVSIFSCKKDDDPKPDCSECGKSVENVKDRSGTINYDSTAAQYYVFMHVPGSIDSFAAGYVCDLSEEFQQVGKKVTVSGTNYETAFKLPLGICCVNEYCLALSSVNEQ